MIQRRSNTASRADLRQGARALLVAALGAALLAGCATRSDYDTYYFAEQGDLDAALSAAEAARGGGFDGFFFGTGAGECRDYAAVVTVLVAKGDFAGASRACADYDEQCAVLPDSSLCFYYRKPDLAAAASDADLAQTMVNEARDNLHFRWLMIRDDYEKRGLKRPIY
jgi:hypothetical protein